MRHKIVTLTGKTFKTTTFMIFVAGLLLVALPPSAVGDNCDPRGQTRPALPPSVASDPSPWTFFTWSGKNFTGTTTTEDPLAGDTIEVTAAGKFDDVAGTIVGSGSFAHFDERGKAVARGTWTATTFTSFELLSPTFEPGTIPEPAFVGGILRFEATFDPPLAGAPHHPVTFYCRFRAADKVPFEGTAVGPFDLPLSGTRTGLVHGLRP